MIDVVLKPQNVQRAVVVLGYRLSDQGKLQQPLIDRLNLGIKHFRRGGWQAIITCGWRANKLHALLGRFNEAEAGRDYICARHNDIPVFTEPDSTSIQENLLFTRKRFPALKEVLIVTAAHALERTRFHATIVFGDEVKVEIVPCEEGVSNAEREHKMRGDVRHILEMAKINPGEWRKLMLPSKNGRLRSKWDDLAKAHESCYWRRNHLRHPE